MPLHSLPTCPRCNSHTLQEWTARLRSSLHPELFALVYRVASTLADTCGLGPSSKAELLLAAPKLTQALFAALLDCYTWKLAEKAYGRGSRTAYTTVRNPHVRFQICPL